MSERVSYIISERWMGDGWSVVAVSGERILYVLEKHPTKDEAQAEADKYNRVHER